MVKHEAGPHFIKNVGCYGLESSLLNCSHSRDIQAECDAIEVHCIPGKKRTRTLYGNILVPFSVAKIAIINFFKKI